MQILLKEIKNIKVIYMEGNKFSLLKILKGLNIINQKNNKFILNISDVYQFNSSSISAIINFDIALHILMDKNYLQLLHYFRLNRSMSLYYSLAFAIESFL